MARAANLCLTSLRLALVCTLALTCLLSSTNASSSPPPSSSTPSSSSSVAPKCRVHARWDRERRLPSEYRRPSLLFWDTEGANYEMFGIWFGKDAYLNCPVQCEILSGRNRLAFSKADAVMFWATPNDKGLMFADKCHKQLWMQTSTEAFDISILDRTPPKGLLANGTKSPIDYEVSWRRGLGSERSVWLNNYDWNLDFTRAFQNEEFLDPLSVKTKTKTGRDKDQAAVAAFISNCGAVSPRLAWLEELQKHIKVDSYGRCAHNKDIPPHWTEEADISRGLLMQKNTILSKRYKFLLAFENQQTEDYVTEKFYHPLSIGVLPIVMGAPNIEEYSPNLPNFPRAFINIDHYNSTEELAKYIQHLDDDDDAYRNFFAWRHSKQFRPLFRDAVQFSWRDSPCQVCQTIHHELYGTPIRSILPEDYDQRSNRAKLSPDYKRNLAEEKKQLLKTIRAEIVAERKQRKQASQQKDASKDEL